MTETLFELVNSIQADLWIFDNDGTIYNPDKIEPAINELIINFIATHYNLSTSSAKLKRQLLRKKYQTRFTLVALEKEGVNPDEFIREAYLAINPRDFGIYEDKQLQNLFSSIQGEKIVLTNNPSEFANIILDSLGIKKYFSKIIGMRELNYCLKPDPRSFSFLFPILKKGKKIIFVDDEVENIIIAKEIGFMTVLVGSDEQMSNYCVKRLI
jgi:pyrimidine 5'-nucleotidase